MTKYLRNSCLALMCVCITLFAASVAQATDEKSGFGLGMKLMQDLWRGVTETQRKTTCRLATKRVYKGDQICVYTGANRTVLGIYNSAGDYCATAMDCKYEPHSDKTVGQLVQDFIDAADE
jgi:hypothetical protein